MNAADFGGGEINLVEGLSLKKNLDIGLPGQIEFAAATGYDVGMAMLLELADDGGSDHSTMPGNEDPGAIHV
jgi:hypothetical protein